MHRCDVEIVFEKRKKFLIRDCVTSSNPVAIILGGQPASPGNVITTARNEQLENKEMVNEAEKLSKHVSSQMP